MEDETTEVESTAEEAISEPQAEAVEQTTETQPEDFYKSQYENLQKDYTRKSQELAEIKKIKDEPKPEAKAEPEPWEKEGWQPKTWQEALEAGKRMTLKEVSPLLSEVQKERQQKEALTKVQQAAEAEILAIKEKDPLANEDNLYKTANKYSISLTAAHQFLKDIQGMEKTVEQRVLKNLKIRDADGVGVSSATSPADDTPTYQEISSQRSIGSAARAALRLIQGK